MAIEIERKFLVTNTDYISASYACEEIIQGYLSSVPERTVRIRIKGNKAYITVKGISNASGLSRYEWEKEIPLAEARELIKLCETGVIDKIRYFVKNGNHTLEVDEFRGENQGLTVAEIELSYEDETFDIPHWLGLEVTGDTRYYNASLTKCPYTKW